MPHFPVFLLCWFFFNHITSPSEIDLISLEMHLQCHPLTWHHSVRLATSLWCYMDFSFGNPTVHVSIWMCRTRFIWAPMWLRTSVSNSLHFTVIMCLSHLHDGSRELIGMTNLYQIQKKILGLFLPQLLNQESQNEASNKSQWVRRIKDSKEIFLISAVPTQTDGGIRKWQRSGKEKHQSYIGKSDVEVPLNTHCTAWIGSQKPHNRQLM